MRKRIVSNITIPDQLFSSGEMFKIRLTTLKEAILQVPLCQLQSSRFQMTIISWSQLNHFSLLVPNSECNKLVKPRSGKFKLTLVTSLQTFGSRPILSIMPDPQDTTSQNQPFFIRYWYIILPILIFLFMPIGEAPH